MRILSIIITVIGAIAIILSVIQVLAHVAILGLTGAGWLRGATALLLLALVLIAYDHECCCKEKK